MANLFEKLPHLLGTITNLDKSDSMRAMASIKSELARRQRIFGDCNVNHINGYNKLFKLGKVEEPLPHLFIISDEFAELKKEQPEFMTELVSAARIGRSLGIHLILATQKPSGVVDDQIWTNSKFKLCLKVQNAGDRAAVVPGELMILFYYDKGVYHMSVMKSSEFLESLLAQYPDLLTTEEEQVVTQSQGIKEYWSGSGND